LGDGARRILDSPNAGGNSIWSEALSFEVLNAMFGAKLLCTGSFVDLLLLSYFITHHFFQIFFTVTEMQICYFPMGGKITDYSVSIFNQPIGVSVTRALKFHGEFCDADAIVLLTKKLYGVNESSRLVSDPHRWKKQILHVWAENVKVAHTLTRVWKQMDASLIANTMVLITVTEHNARFIFKN
jgi:hypothetical protein